MGERNDLRSEIVEMERMLLKVGLFFITVIGASIGTLITSLTTHTANNLDVLNKEIDFFFDIKITVANSIILALTQIEFFLAMIGVLIMCNMFVHAAYIQAQEIKINKIIGEYILMWESEISGKYINHYKAPFFWICGILGIILYIFYFFLIYKVASDLKWVSWIVAIFTVEFFAPIVLLFFQTGKLETVHTNAIKKFNEPIP